MIKSLDHKLLEFMLQIVFSLCNLLSFSFYFSNILFKFCLKSIHSAFRPALWTSSPYLLGLKPILYAFGMKKMFASIRP